MLRHHLLFFGRDRSRSTEQTGSPLLFEPIALSLNVERGTVVQQTVQDGRGQDVVVEDLAPIQEALVAGEDGGAAPTATGDARPTGSP